MKSKRSFILIVSISIFIALLHFVFGPKYNGVCKEFIRSYLIDLLLPVSVYLLLQLALRKYFSILKSRITGCIIILSFGILVEILQLYNIGFLGSTYDPVDILMYSGGILTGLFIDIILISKFEKQV